MPQLSGHRLLFDLESDGLLDTITRLHCIVTEDIDTGLVRRFRSSAKYGSGESIEEGLEYLASASLLVGHNILDYDLRAIAKCHPRWTYKGEVLDTLVCSFLIWTNLYERDLTNRRIPPALYGRHSLKAWGHRLKVYKGDFGETTDWKEWTQEMEDYCVQDVVVTRAVYRLVVAQNYDPRALELEHDFKRLIIMQEAHGFRFDVEAGEKFAAQLQVLRQDLTEKLQAIFPPTVETMKMPAYYTAGGQQFTTKGAARKARFKDAEIVAGPLKTKTHLFNPGSRDQIADRLIAKYGWKPDKFTDGGKPEISEGVLALLTYPEAPLLGEFLQVEKTLSQLAEGKGAVMKLVRNGRVHGRVNTNGAVTGRCTHSTPNVSQTPAVLVKKGADGKKAVVTGLEGGFGWEFRSLYCADLEWELTGWDASALELRCLAHYLARYDDGKFEKILLEGDVHTTNQTAAGLYLRDSAKTFIYAYLYGAGDEKIGKIVRQDAIDAGKPLPKGNLQAIGKALKAKFLKNFPALKKLKDAIDAALNERAYLIGIDGRKLHVRSKHAALNTILQSAGGLLMKKALSFQYRALVAQGLQFGKDFAFVANIHDEVQTTHRKGLGEIVGKSGPAALKQAGEFFGFRCRLDGEFKTGLSWAATH